MTSPVFKKTIFISLLGHLTVFSIFSFSFGNSIPKAQYFSVSFWGQFLRNSQVNQPITRSIGLHKNDFFSTRRVLGYYLNPVRNTMYINANVIVSNGVNPIRDTANSSNDVIASSGVKPPFTLAFNLRKETFIKKFQNPLFSAKKREPTIIFHPLLPYGFTLYFKDRQIAHVELMYKAISAGERNSILIKRKISSGNLEVDLLVMRYIGHYLFIQQTSMLTNNWQTIKIDLSAKND